MDSALFNEINRYAEMVDRQKGSVCRNSAEREGSTEDKK